MDLKLTGRRALITGGSKGIGLAIARLLASEGCHLHLVARSGGDLARVGEELRQRHGVEVRVHAIDLAERGRAAELAALCADIDILVNNAGATPRGSLLDVDEERWRAAFDLKVFGYINLTRAFYRQMKARHSGVIINIIGNGGERLDAGYIAGATGNAALPPSKKSPPRWRCCPRICLPTPRAPSSPLTAAWRTGVRLSDAAQHWLNPIRLPNNWANQ